jgi:hypothetical protein
VSLVSREQGRKVVKVVKVVQVVRVNLKAQGEAAAGAKARPEHLIIVGLVVIPVKLLRPGFAEHLFFGL